MEGFQIILSPPNLQAGKVTDARTIRTPHESQTRVKSMARRQTCSAPSNVGLAEYNWSLIVDNVDLELDQVVPRRLILNELMTNAMKYAIADGRQVTLHIELPAEPEKNLNLLVTDDGVGLPAKFEITTARSLGLQLVGSLLAC